MKKITPIALFALLAAAGVFAGCASAQTEEKPAFDASSLQNLTLENVLQKSAEMRDQINNAKTVYSTAQQVNNAANLSDNALDAVKNMAQEKIDSIKQQVKDEKKAWKETLSK